MRDSSILLPPQRSPNHHSRHLVIMLVIALVLIGAGTLLILNHFASHTTNTVPLSPTPQGGKVVAIHNPQQVPTALLQFIPLGASDSIGTALMHATGNTQANRLPAHFRVYLTSQHRYFVSISILVNIRLLEQDGEIITGHAPGASSLKSGDLYIAGNMHGYGVRMNPHTHLAIFEFYLSPQDTTVWAINWNALGIISQNSSLN
ncbi:MAG: hypothetical protein C7B46_14675 [Sulfobacillus benefaciens]|uniref:Uncharacterized protein n=1 Tax=Sulfobacillus benefaciens TaxID=453960 RepID=A0A2T2XD07_9FIRM|nr:MAG: hypothetical protein C7B46_14675 [Sulfobacillus benefaciens]